VMPCRFSIFLRSPSGAVLVSRDSVLEDNTRMKEHRRVPNYQQ
jgi:hypothetical protein